MSDFARKQLEKYGWTEGKGLGKREDGITKPIKASMKFDNQGIGHDNLDVWTSTWWYDAFNQAANRIKVINTEKGVRVKSEKPCQKTSALPSANRIKKTFVKEKNLEEQGQTSESEFNVSESLSKKTWNYDSLKKPKSSRKMKHIRIMEQDAIYEKEMEKRKKHKKSKNKDS